MEEKIKEKAEGLLRAKKSCMAESFVVQRNGRICLPVKKEYKSRVEGSVIDRSSSGATLFIEPAALSRLREELEVLRIEEDRRDRGIRGSDAG